MIRYAEATDESCVTVIYWAFRSTLRQAGGQAFATLSLFTPNRSQAFRVSMTSLDRIYQHLVIDAVMIGRDQGGIILSKSGGIKGDGGAAGKFGMLAGLRYFGNVGIEIIDARATVFEKLHQLERWALPHVVDIFLVGDAQDENPCAIQSLAETPVELVSQPRNHILRHCCIDLAGKFDEPMS